jgi:acetyl-CoA/propionyl-CoA carboxylase biotin carboxyl carrier protein
VDDVARLGTVAVADETIILRDQLGNKHRATIQPDGRVRVGDVELKAVSDGEGGVRVEGARNTFAWSVVAGDVRWVFVSGEVFTFEVERPLRGRRRSAAHHGSLTAPMPATVRKIIVGPGDPVRRGDVLIVLEAMKMELPVRAPSDGVVDKVNCREGEMVQAGQELAEVTA